VAVSGGRTPEPVFEQLAARAGEFDRWRNSDVFWCDERLVPPSDLRSNFGLARRLWLTPAGVPRENVHPVPSSLPLEDAAREYEADLRGRFDRTAAPTFDAVLLGVGPDGHTASLFPGAPALDVRDRWAAGEPRPAQPPLVPRVTLTLEGLRHGRVAIFLVCGAEKRAVLARLLGRSTGETERAKLPAARVSAVDAVEWFLDRDAAPPGIGTEVPVG
jgi:6-phosphogluconolactonase